MVLIKSTAENCLHTKKLLIWSQWDAICHKRFTNPSFQQQKHLFCSSCKNFSLSVGLFSFLLISESDTRNDLIRCRGTKVHIFLPEDNLNNSQFKPSNSINYTKYHNHTSFKRENLQFYKEMRSCEKHKTLSLVTADFVPPA